jgi:hypothetical protein
MNRGTGDSANTRKGTGEKKKKEVERVRVIPPLMDVSNTKLSHYIASHSVLAIMDNAD